MTGRFAQRIHDLCRELLSTGHIHAFCLFIVKGICEQQNMEISLDIAVHTAVRKVDIRIGFKVDGKYTSAQ